MYRPMGKARIEIDEANWKRCSSGNAYHEPVTLNKM